MWYGYRYGYLAAAYHFPNDMEVQSHKCPKMGTKGLATAVKQSSDRDVGSLRAYLV